MLSRKLFFSCATFFVLVSLIFISSVVASSEMWSQTYGGAEDDIAYSLVVTSDGGYAIAGETNSFGAGNSDFWLVKTDAYGNMEWNQTYGGAGCDVAYSLVVTSDGGYAIAGETNSFGAGNSDFWLIKTDAYGNMEWNQTYGGVDADIARSVAETPDGGYALAGDTYSLGASRDDFWLVKTDSYGNLEWNMTFGGEEFETANSLIVTSNGGFAIAGATNIRVNYSDADFWLIKTDADGNMEWNQTYSTWVDYANSVVETSDGGYAIVGSSGFWSPQNCWLVKTNENGIMSWNKNYGRLDDNYEEAANSLVETADGGFILAGQTDWDGAGGADFWVIKTDEKGKTEWNQTYGGAEDDIAYSLVVTSDGGYAIAGETNSFGAGNSDFWLIKTDAQGIPEFPSWAVLLLLLLAIVVGMVYRKKMYRTQTQQSY